MALLRKSIRRVSLNIAGRIRERNKSAGGEVVENNAGVTSWGNSVERKTNPVGYVTGHKCVWGTISWDELGQGRLNNAVDEKWLFKNICNMFVGL